MKFKANKKYTRIAVYAGIVIIICGFVLISAKSIPAIGDVFGFIGNVLTPIIWGMVIGYLLNTAMKFFEFKVFSGWQKKAVTKKQKSRIRSLSLAITVVVFLAIFVGFLALLLPQILQSIKGIIKDFPQYMENVRSWAKENFGDNPEMLAIINNPLDLLQNSVEDLWTEFKPQMSSILSGMGNGALTVLYGLKDFIIGFIIAIYMVLSKDMVAIQLKKVMFAFMDNDRCLGIIRVYHKTNDIFQHYLTGLIIDAFLVGCFTFIGASIIGTPFAALIGIVVGITNFIPFFGPFLGGIPSALLIFIQDPLKAVWFAIFMVVLQQLDGNIMVPFIQGDKTGVPSLWILMSIIIGGGLFGFAGMLLAVPVFAVIYMLIKEYIEAKLEKKNMPTDSLCYDNGIDRFTSGFEYSDEERAADNERRRLSSESVKTRKFKLKRNDDNNNG